MTRRTEPLPRNWPTIRHRILTRDNWACQLRIHCNGTQATEVHHTGPPNNHADHLLLAACKHCHATITARQANQARRQKYSRLREPEPHPGQLPHNPNPPPT